VSQRYFSPVIVTGMHRSGTSIVTRLLEKLGLLVGVKKDQNCESIFFQDLNKWMLLQCDGSWEHPRQIHYILDNPDILTMTADYLQYWLKTPHIVAYLGLANYLRYLNMFRISRPWGWKDPRNTFTLPIWLKLFPEAKVINIYRHGLDIAQSLKTRHDSYLAQNAQLHERRKWYYWTRMKRGGFAGATRSATLDGAFAIWEEYMEEDFRQAEALGERVVRVKYEDFLESPCDVLEKLVAFCGLDASQDDIASVTGELRKSRRYAYLQNEKLKPWAEKYKSNLAKFGY